MALRLPDAERAVLGKVLAADLALLASLEAGIVVAEAALGEVLADTPAAHPHLPARGGGGAGVELRRRHR